MSDEQGESRPRRNRHGHSLQQQPASSRCVLLLQRSLAIQLSRGASPGLLGPRQRDCSPDPEAELEAELEPEQHPADEMWMYDKGYNLFQGFLEANSRCWWNIALVEATRQLRYRGHCAPGVLMVGGPACALEVLRAAWARNVLRPPADHVITCLGDIEDCLLAPVAQGQFTPLPEALCWAILELTSARQAATLDRLRAALRAGFPAMQRPSRDMVYDALAKLMQERKIYHTAQGYFVVTPETRRLRRQQQQQQQEDREARAPASEGPRASPGGGRHRMTRPGGQAMLMSSDEAVALVHGEMLTLRDGSVTHQAVQTNLADVICGGNPNDKVLTARCRSVPSRLERRHSLRLWGSARRLHRSGSSRSLPRRAAAAAEPRSDTSSSAEYASTDSAPHSPTKKIGLLSRLFRRSTRRASKPAQPLVTGTFAAQYPPSEWFNPRVVHLHSVATQTRPASPSMLESGLESQSQSQASFQAWDSCESSVRSATLPRRQQHRRQPSVDSASLLLQANSTPRSSRRSQRSPCRSTLPLRSKCSSLSRCTSRASVQPGNGSESNRPPPSQPAQTAQQPKTAACSSASSLAGRLPSGSRHPPSSTGKPANSPQHKVLQKSSSTHSSQSSSSGSRLSSPLKLAQSEPQQPQQQQPLSPLQEGQAQNSITLQVSTALSPGHGQDLGRGLPSLQSSLTLASNASSTSSTTTTISGSPGTKIYVQQNNSPMRSVITFENKQQQQPQPQPQPQTQTQPSDKEEAAAKPELRQSRPERPSSLYEVTSVASSSDKENEREPKLKLTNNRLNNSQAQLHDFAAGKDFSKDGNELAMNNSRKLSLSLSKDALSYRNLLRQPQQKPNNSSNPPSPTKPYEQQQQHQQQQQQQQHSGFGGSINNMLYIENLEKQSKQHSNLQQQQQQQQGSQPNLDKSELLSSYPSLSDMQVHFTSLAAQKILKGCPLNSVDTLVEVNMAAATATTASQDKPNNCDLTVHTDFGLV